MHSIIDAAEDLSAHAGALARAGVRTVIRYYNHRNSARLPTKRLEPAEARALAAAGLALGAVFQQRGGAGGEIGDLTSAAGARDGARAAELAARIGQPEGSAIHFAVDHDFVAEAELAAIEGYFAAARAALSGRWRTGVYGSGLVARRMLGAGLADLAWLAAPLGWAGTRDMLPTADWALFQAWPQRVWAPAGLRYDGNIASPAVPDFGQFRLADAPPPGGPEAPDLRAVTARSGLNLRRGPGTGFAVERVLAPGAVVSATARAGDWVRVDLEGDGAADGFVHGAYLAPLAGGEAAPPAPGATPLDIARAELARDVREIPGPRHNPRILLYHATTRGGAAADEVPWCASFVNFCVERAGLAGTGTKWALDWHDTGWGTDATAAPREGDIAVFRRREGGPGGAVRGGHVGFWLGAEGGRVALLGGNQSNRVRISRYPADGRLGRFHYELVSVRRP